MPRIRRKVIKEELPSSSDEESEEEVSPPQSEVEGEEKDSSPLSRRDKETKEGDQTSGSESDDGSSENEENDDPNVVLNDAVLNITYYDSSDEEDVDDFDEEEPEHEPEYNDKGEEIDNTSIDDDTEEKFSILTERLEEVAYVIYTGKNSFRINFQNKRGVKLVPKGESCDFDIDDDGLPVMYDGGESFILPYLLELCRRRSDLKPFQITTNCSKRRYNF